MGGFLDIDAAIWSDTAFDDCVVVLIPSVETFGDLLASLAAWDGVGFVPVESCLRDGFTIREVGRRDRAEVARVRHNGDAKRLSMYK